jgi:hypothetical protein
MEDLFDTSVRGIFERLLKGEFDYLSAIVLPRANDSAHRLYYYLCELKRTGEAKLPLVLLCDVVMTPDDASRHYSIDALGRLWEELKAIGRRDAGDAELRAAVVAQNRRAKWAMGPIISRRVGSIPGEEALACFAAVHMLALDRLEAAGPPKGAIVSAGERPSGPRVMICGSAQTDGHLHGIIETASGIVVMDYHSGGELSVMRLSVDEALAPLEAIADRLRKEQAASRRFADVAGETATFARALRVDLAIFSYFPEEEALTWDYPEQKAALEAAGLRVLRLPEQTRPFDVASNRAVVEAFVRGVGK